MTFEIDNELLEIYREPGPGFGETAWFLYPGCPPMFRFFEASWADTPRDETYSRDSACLLIALIRLEALYDRLSAHEKMRVHEQADKVKRYRSNVR